MQTGTATAWWQQRVNTVKDYIRANLTSDLKLASVAEVAHASPYHFHRMFKAVCGETVAAFTRRARLERAAYLMKAAPKRPLGSIAIEAGFPTLAEFSRAFKRQYGLAPRSWDRSSELNILPDCVQEIPPYPANHAFDAQIVSHDACRLAYIRIHTWFEVDKLKVGFTHLTDWLAARGVDWRHQPLIGMSWDHYQTTPIENIRYDLAFPVPEIIAGDGEFGIYTLPAFRAVEVHCQGSLVTVAQAWDYLYDDWFVASRYEPANLPAMKRFCQHPDVLDWASWDLKCSIALMPAQP